MPVTKVLVVDDEVSLREVLVRFLSFRGYETLCAADGNEALAIVRSHRPDVIVTDIRMPVLNGIDLVKVLREDPATRLTPIIMLTGVPDRASQRRSMETGADDYITKPFKMEELLGAIAAQLRRRQWLAEPDMAGPGADCGASTVVEFAHWRYDVERRMLNATDGSRTERRLTISEARLLNALIEHPGRTIDRQELLDRMGRSAASPFDRSVDVFINHLRRKIETDARNPTLLKTVRSAGYVFDLTHDQIRRRGAGVPGPA